METSAASTASLAPARPEPTIERGPATTAPSAPPQGLATSDNASFSAPSLINGRVRWGIEGSAAPTVSFGEISGENALMVGGRLEAGATLAGNEIARVGAVGAAQIGVGNALVAGAGLGLKGEVGKPFLNAYGSVMATGNLGIGPCGPTAGIGVRTAVGAQAGLVYGEVAHDWATNMDMTSVSLGIRARF